MCVCGSVKQRECVCVWECETERMCVCERERDSARVLHSEIAYQWSLATRAPVS